MELRRAAGEHDLAIALHALRCTSSHTCAPVPGPSRGTCSGPLPPRRFPRQFCWAAASSGRLAAHTRDLDLRSGPAPQAEPATATVGRPKPLSASVPQGSLCGGFQFAAPRRFDQFGQPASTNSPRWRARGELWAAPVRFDLVVAIAARASRSERHGRHAVHRVRVLGPLCAPFDDSVSSATAAGDGGLIAVRQAAARSARRLDPGMPRAVSRLCPPRARFGSVAAG